MLKSFVSFTIEMNSFPNCSSSVIFIFHVGQSRVDDKHSGCAVVLCQGHAS